MDIVAVVLFVYPREERGSDFDLLCYLTQVLGNDNTCLSDSSFPHRAVTIAIVVN